MKIFLIKVIKHVVVIIIKKLVKKLVEKVNTIPLKGNK